MRFRFPLPSPPSQFFGHNKDVVHAVYFENALIKVKIKTLEVGVMSDGSWPNRTTTIIYNTFKTLITYNLQCHNTEWLHLPI